MSRRTRRWQTRPEPRPSDLNAISDLERASLITVPKGSPFEIRPSPGKGLGVFATTDIKPGSRVLIEPPLLIITGRTLAQVSSKDVSEALRKLPREKRDDFLSLRNFHENNTTYRTALATFINYYMRPSQQTKVDDGSCQTHGVYPLMYMFNNSCVPNASCLPRVTGLNAGAQAVTAISHIRKDQEITIMYDSNWIYKTNAQRQRDSFRCLDFDTTCSCIACGYKQSARLASDMRRLLLRGLRLLVRDQTKMSENPDMDLQCSTMRDPKESTEDFRLRSLLLTRYYTLMAMLAEAEGLVDNPGCHLWITAAACYGNAMSHIVVGDPCCTSHASRMFYHVKLGLVEKYRKSLTTQVAPNDPKLITANELVKKGRLLLRAAT